MAVFENSRHATAGWILEVTQDPATGIETDPIQYLDNDRKTFKASDFRDNIVFKPDAGSTPDQVAYEVYGQASLAWVVGEFNDSVGFDMFRTFDGLEDVILPSPETLFTVILGQS